MTLSIGLSGLANAGYAPIYMDISPYYAGQLFGVSNTLSNVAGILAPIVAGDLLGNKVGAAALRDWRCVFFIAAIVYAVAGLLFVAFMRAKPIQALN